MKKNRILLFPDGRGTPQAKHMRMLKLSLFMFAFLFWQVSASSYSQKTKLTIDAQRVSVREVFQTIKSQSEFTFIFNEEDIEQLEEVTLNLTGETVESVLQKCLKNSELTWTIMDDVIIINSPNQGAQSQSKIISIKGKVSDDQGMPIPGASVVVQGYNHGAITDANGNYEIKVPETATNLVFSFIGFTMQTVAINDQKVINVVLRTSVSEIENVVVVGYFNQAKESFTGAAVTFSAEELLQAGNQNVLQSLQLLDPSFMQVENTLDGSNPNTLPEFQIRGSASVNMQGEYQGNPNIPTFILDGFEVSIEKIYDLDPYRVKSVTILKDAAATAIYGSRAANGVVVIETMAPKAGKMTVSYKGDFTFAGADLSEYDLLNAEEKLALEVAGGLYDTHGVPIEKAEILRATYNEKLKLVEQGYNTYWLNKPIEKLSTSHKHSFLLEGGGDEIRYGIDLNFNDQNGVMKESGRDRVGLGLKLQYTYKNLTIRNKLTYDYVKAINSPYGTFSTYTQLNPYYRYQDDQGNYLYALESFSDGKVFNPLYNATLNTIDENTYDQLINNFDMDWKLDEDWRLRSSFSINKKIFASDEFKPGIHTLFASQTNIAQKGHYIASRGESIGWTANLILNYFKRSDKHVINGNAILEASEQSDEAFSMKAVGFPNEDMDNIDFAIQYESSGKPKGTEYTSRRMGVTANMNYSYDDRLLLDASCRADGSSSFGADKRWAPFWAIGTGWNLHKESFMKQFSFINRLKLRGSYGSTGSVAFNPYQAMMMYKYRTDQIHRFEAGLSLMGLGNENLKWQQTLKRNLGIDFMFFKRRLSGTINYYNDLSKNMLVDIDLAPSLGFAQYKENLGESQNAGYELNVRYDILKNRGGFSWSIYGNIAHNENTLLKLSESLQQFNADQNEAAEKEESTKPRVLYIEGQSMTSLWANKSLGIDPATGKEIFVTQDGGTSLEWSSDNLMVCGDASPDFWGSFGSNVTYKGFFLNAVFRYRYGGQYYNQTLVDRVENADVRYNVDRRILEARWEKPGDITFYKDVQDRSYTRATSRFIQDYNFLELATINASYEFNTQVANKVGFKRLKMTFYMNDILRLSSVKAERGTNYPFARSFSIGIQGRF